MMAKPKPRTAPAQWLSRLAVELHIRRLTLADFADAAGVCLDTASRWGRGTTSPRGEVAARAYAWLSVHGIDPATVFASGEPALESLMTQPLTLVPDPKEEDMETPSLEYLEAAELQRWTDELYDSQGDFYPARLTDARDTIRRHQIVAIHAEPGAGKSFLVRRILARSLTMESIRFILPRTLNRQDLTSRGLAIAIVRDLGKHDRLDGLPNERLAQLLQESLKDQLRSGAFPVLLIDEAHMMPWSSLLAIKHVWDSGELYKQLGVILIGQPPLRDTLKKDVRVRELVGRTRILNLPTYDAQTTGDYLRWRFARVGGDADKVFAPAAMKVLSTRGEYPLWINSLAVRAMRYACTLGESRVDAVHAGRA